MGSHPASRQLRYKEHPKGGDTAESVRGLKDTQLLPVLWTLRAIEGQHSSAIPAPANTAFLQPLRKPVRCHRPPTGTSSRGTTGTARKHGHTPAGIHPGALVAFRKASRTQTPIPGGDPMRTQDVLQV